LGGAGLCRFRVRDRRGVEVVGEPVGDEGRPHADERADELQDRFRRREAGAAVVGKHVLAEDVQPLSGERPELVRGWVDGGGHGLAGRSWSE
jgi:hypothetical protein